MFWPHPDESSAHAATAPLSIDADITRQAPPTFPRGPAIPLALDDQRGPMLFAPDGYGLVHDEIAFGKKSQAEEDLEDEIKQLEKDIKDLLKQIKKTQKDIKKAQKDIAKYQKKIDDLADKKLPKQQAKIDKEQDKWNAYNDLLAFWLSAYVDAQAMPETTEQEQKDKAKALKKALQEVAKLQKKLVQQQAKIDKEQAKYDQYIADGLDYLDDIDDLNDDINDYQQQESDLNDDLDDLEDQLEDKEDELEDLQSGGGDPGGDPPGGGGGDPPDPPDPPGGGGGDPPDPPPPPPPPSGTAGSATAPLWIQEAVHSKNDGVGRVDGIATFGLPFAEGQVGQVGGRPALAVTNTSHYQFRTLETWPDNSVKWALIDVLADVPANGINFEHETAPGNGASGQADIATDLGNRIALNTGPLQADVDKDDFNLFDRVVVDGLEIVSTDASAGILGFDTDFAQLRPDQAQTTVSIEENGPARAVVRADGTLERPDGTDVVDFTCRITARAKSSSLEVTFTIRNANINRPAHVQIEGVELIVRTNPGANAVGTLTRHDGLDAAWITASDH
ncbi:MAG: exo-rhamnogalacturonan lyase family protein, partial [Planctomycetota bacterium]